MSYQDFLKTKAIEVRPNGLANCPEINSSAFDYQQHCIDFAVRQGRAALFMDTGLGKTISQLEFARIVHQHENKPVLLLAPLAVGAQTQREAAKFGIDAKVIREQSEVTNTICIANYERMPKLDAGAFCGVVLDESSILKSYTGITTRALIAAFKHHRWRMACTATPAPNDHTELGNHSEFLGALPMSDMLPRWFVHDSMNTKDWRIKGHAVASFWDFVASWSRCVTKPSDLGFDDGPLQLPPLVEKNHVVESDLTEGAAEQGQLFRMPEMSATNIHDEKRRTIDARADKLCALINAEPSEPWIVWVDTDYEADAVMKRLPNAIEVSGKMSADMKEERLIGFSNGDFPILVTKPKIAGFGMNWQHCARVGFVGLSFSYESYYQAVRRCYRFGQKRDVHVHTITSDTELAIFKSINRKKENHAGMKREMAAAMQRVSQPSYARNPYAPTETAQLPEWMKAA